jgi:hypothetical protein
MKFTKVLAINRKTTPLEKKEEKELFLLPAHWDPLRAGFLLRILWCSQSGNHQENNLAIWLYTRYESRKKQNPSMFLVTYWNLLSKKIYSKNKLFEIWQFGSFFSMKNPFYWLESYFSGRNLAKIRQ